MAMCDLVDLGGNDKAFCALLFFFLLFIAVCDGMYLLFCLYDSYEFEVSM